MEEPEIRASFARLKSQLIEQRDTITAKAVRRLMEKDLKLESKALDDHKQLINDLIDQAILSEAENVPPQGKSPQTAAKRKRSKNGDEENGGRAKKLQKPRTGEEGSSKKARQESKEDGADREQKAGPGPTSELLEQMKRICKEAGIRVPVNVYKNKSVQSREDALRKYMLDNHGLTSDASDQQIKNVKRSLQKQRELDGIELDNIIDTTKGRASRGARYTAAWQQFAQGEDEDDDDDGINAVNDDGDDDDEEDDDGRAAAGGSKAEHRRKGNSDDAEGDEEDSDSQGDEADGRDDNEDGEDDDDEDDEEFDADDGD